MRLLASIYLVIFALIAAPAGAAPTGWARTVTQTPEGNYVLGNPKATRLIEYVSYTCSHCAHFVAEGSGPLRDQWVRHGLLSVEVRNAVRDPYDMTAAILARCGGPARFFALHEALFANQGAWMAKLQAYDPSRGDQKGMTPAQIMIGMADGTGLTTFLAKKGLPAARQRQCLMNKAEIGRMTAAAHEAWNVRKISGTPAFVLGGTLVGGVGSWDGLQPRLPALPK